MVGRGECTDGPRERIFLKNSKIKKLQFLGSPVLMSDMALAPALRVVLGQIMNPFVMSYDSSALSTPRYRGHLLNYKELFRDSAESVKYAT